MTAEKIRENKLRRMAERQGLTLRKSKRRDQRASDYGMFWLIDANTNAVVGGGSTGMNVDSVEAWLVGDHEGAPS